MSASASPTPSAGRIITHKPELLNDSGDEEGGNFAQDSLDTDFNPFVAPAKETPASGPASEQANSPSKGESQSPAASRSRNSQPDPSSPRGDDGEGRNSGVGDEPRSAHSGRDPSRPASTHSRRSRGSARSEPREEASGNIGESLAPEEEQLRDSPPPESRKPGSAHSIHRRDSGRQESLHSERAHSSSPDPSSSNPVGTQPSPAAVSHDHQTPLPTQASRSNSQERVKSQMSTQAGQQQQDLSQYDDDQRKDDSYSESDEDIIAPPPALFNKEKEEDQHSTDSIEEEQYQQSLKHRVKVYKKEIKKMKLPPDAEKEVEKMQKRRQRKKRGVASSTESIMTDSLDTAENTPRLEEEEEPESQHRASPLPREQSSDAEADRSYDQGHDESPPPTTRISPDSRGPATPPQIVQEPAAASPVQSQGARQTAEDRSLAVPGQPSPQLLSPQPDLSGPLVTPLPNLPANQQQEDKPHSGSSGKTHSSRAKSTQEEELLFRQISAQKSADSRRSKSNQSQKNADSRGPPKSQSPKSKSQFGSKVTVEYITDESDDEFAEHFVDEKGSPIDRQGHPLKVKPTPPPPKPESGSRFRLKNRPKLSRDASQSSGVRGDDGKSRQASGHSSVSQKVDGSIEEIKELQQRLVSRMEKQHSQEQLMETKLQKQQEEQLRLQELQREQLLKLQQQQLEQEQMKFELRKQSEEMKLSQQHQQLQHLQQIQQQQHQLQEQQEKQRQLHEDQFKHQKLEMEKQQQQLQEEQEKELKRLKLKQQQQQQQQQKQKQQQQQRQQQPRQAGAGLYPPQPPYQQRLLVGYHPPPGIVGPTPVLYGPPAPVIGYQVDQEGLHSPYIPLQGSQSFDGSYVQQPTQPGEQPPPDQQSLLKPRVPLQSGPFWSEPTIRPVHRERYGFYGNPGNPHTIHGNPGNPNRNPGNPQQNPEGYGSQEEFVDTEGYMYDYGDSANYYYDGPPPGDLDENASDLSPHLAEMVSTPPPLNESQQNGINATHRFRKPPPAPPPKPSKNFIGLNRKHIVKEPSQKGYTNAYLEKKAEKSPQLNPKKPLPAIHHATSGNHDQEDSSIVDNPAEEVWAARSKQLHRAGRPQPPGGSYLKNRTYSDSALQQKSTSNVDARGGAQKVNLDINVNIRSPGLENDDPYGFDLSPRGGGAGKSYSAENRFQPHYYHQNDIDLIPKNPYRSHLHRAKALEDQVNYYKENQEMSPYHVLPSISPGENGGPEEQEGYLSKMMKQRKPPKYKEYTLNEYRGLNKNSINRGGLGRDDALIAERQEKVAKQRAYARSMQELHRQNLQKLRKVGDKLPKPTENISSERASKRQIAIEYAKNVPRPSPKPSDHSTPDSLPEKKSQTPVSQQVAVEMEEIDRLKVRHEEEKKNIQKIRDDVIGNLKLLQESLSDIVSTE